MQCLHIFVCCMKDYLKLPLRENPDHFVLHVGKNDLDSDQSPDLIAKSIVDVASSLKTDNHDVTISNIITLNDLNERNFLFSDHSKNFKSQHLSGSKLHLNRRGTHILQNTFTKVLSSIFS